ncbi:hypothetical protein BDA99DRAFT_557579 [Phascolomyces articulosus]|uniref:F-box domain-containing protein n=1 Tax=Phascolomyces articulosus TaxID=60185 RepID=A0AAD5PGJ9_9FUNG|nr:hypothetical protein BDA99DRAFT_557579 [Phascolomyces articulosus]
MPVRVDFISILPIDITWNILPHFTADELVEFLQVSREWRNRILHCVAAWQDLVIKHHSTLLVETLSLVAKFVQQLKIKRYCEMECICKCVQLMRDGHFNHLKCLKLPSIDMNYMDEYLYLSAIKKMQGTLTEHVLGGDNLPSLEDIISNCPHLTHLAYNAMSSEDLGMSEQGCAALPNELKLTHLFLRITYAVDMDYWELERILQRCPNIKFLDLSQCEPSPLEIICNYIPSIEILSYGGHDSTSFNCRDPFIVSQRSSSVATTSKQQIRGHNNNIINNQKIRRSVFLNIEREQVDGAQMLTLLETYKNELEVLSIRHLDYDGANPDPRWNPLLRFESSTLQNLTFNVHGYPNVLSSILRKCPNIHELELDSLYFFTNTDIESIANAPSLQKCRFDCRLELSLRNMIYFTQCLQKRGPEKGLRLLELNELSCMNDEMLQILAKMTNLKGFKISSSSKSISAMGLQTLFKTLSSNNISTIEYVYLGKAPQVNDKTLAILGEIRTLRRIELVRLYNITNTGILHLISSAASLEHLYILQCSDVITNDTVTFCRNKIPHFTFKKKPSLNAR